jgi:hypothetical protein
MVGMIIAVPQIVSGGLTKRAAVNIDKIEIRVPDATGAPGANKPDAAQRRRLRSRPGGK